MSRAPKVGDYVIVGGYRYTDGGYDGGVAQVIRATDATAWLDKGDPIKASRSKWRSPWDITYVSPTEAARWLAAKAADEAWREAVPECAKRNRNYGDEYIGVEMSGVVRDADECDRRAAIYTAVAAWLRAKPAPADLLISPERGEE